MANKAKNSKQGAQDFITYRNYFLERLVSVAISCFEWSGIDAETAWYLEHTLVHNSTAIFFYDDVLERYLTLRGAMSGVSVYEQPTQFSPISSGINYHRELTDKEAVPIYENRMHNSILPKLEMFARKLAKIEQTIEINLNAQKTPTLILCDQSERLSLENLYNNYDTGTPVIFASKGLNPEMFQVLKTDAPYLVDKLQQHKVNVLTEAYSYLGICGIDIEKKERLISDEIGVSQSITVAQRNNRLLARKQACEQIKKIFGIDVDVKFSENMKTLTIERGRENGSLYN